MSSNQSKKVALLIGINYIGTPNELRGCISDINRMRDFLINKQGFSPSNVQIMTDNNLDKNTTPTRANILRYLTIGVSQMKAGDYFFFHYSGHGSQVPDRSGLEEDGQSETIVPLDFDTNGMIVDTELRTLVNRAPSGSRFVAVIDACHSSSCFNLRYTYDPITKARAKKLGKPALVRGGKLIKADKTLHTESNYEETAAEVICLSGCRDDQTSADVFVDGAPDGAMTAGLLDTLTRNGNNCTLDGIPLACRNYILGKGLGTQVPCLTLGRADFLLTKTLF